MKEDLLQDPVFGMAAEQFDRAAGFFGPGTTGQGTVQMAEASYHGESSSDDG